MDKIKEFSSEVLDLSLKNLSAEFTYLAYPLGLIKYTIGETQSAISTNGESAILNAKDVVKIVAEKGVKDVSILIMHVLMHCIFTHPFKHLENLKAYDLATDITVGYVLDNLGYSHGERSCKEVRKATYKSIIDLLGGLNDGFCYEFCKGLKEEEVDRLYKSFKVCDHTPWYGREKIEGDKSAEEGLNIAFGTMEEDFAEQMSSTWGAVARNLIPQIGKFNPSLKRIISVQVGEVGNYKSFLKSFLRRRERIRPSDEEFDYIYYCLGLQTYGNVPLIENLEYSDRRDFSDLAIAVDTSGSTDGEPIKRLLKEVFSLIKSMETESKKYRVRIIQCDLKIHREDIVCTSDEFSNMLKDYKLEGGGGTDFRPVFEYLSQLKKKGEKIEGLIYFTDGVGLYPREVPPFKTCFAILGTNEGVSVPHFAYRINIED